MKDLIKEGFEEFTGKKTFITEEPMISFTSGGRIGINKRAYQDYLAKYKYIKLFYNKEKKIVAMKATNTVDQNAYSIKKNKNSETGYINSRSFFNHFGIDIATMKNNKIKASWDQESEAFFVQLKL